MSAESSFFIQHNRSIIAIPRRVFRGIFILFFFYKLTKTHLYGIVFNGIVKQEKNQFSITVGRNSKPISPIKKF